MSSKRRIHPMLVVKLWGTQVAEAAPMNSGAVAGAGHPDAGAIAWTCLLSCGCKRSQVSPNADPPTASLPRPASTPQHGQRDGRWLRQRQRRCRPAGPETRPSARQKIYLIGQRQFWRKLSVFAARSVSEGLCVTRSLAYASG